MTDIRITNMNNNADDVLKTELTIKMQVPLSMDDIRQFVHIVDEEDAGPDEGIDPAGVSAIDFITLWVLGEYTGTAVVVADEMEVLK